MYQKLFVYVFCTFFFKTGHEILDHGQLGQLRQKFPFMTGPAKVGGFFGQQKQEEATIIVTKSSQKSKMLGNYMKSYSLFPAWY